MLCDNLDGRGVWGRMDTCIRMAEFLCYPPETITALLIHYTSIQGLAWWFSGKESACQSRRRGCREQELRRGKGHEEGGLAYAKAGSSLRSPPGNSRASTPKPESAYSLLCALTYTSDFTGAVPHYLSLKEELTYSSS